MQMGLLSATQSVGRVRQEGIQIGNYNNRRGNDNIMHTYLESKRNNRANERQNNNGKLILCQFKYRILYFAYLFLAEGGGMFAI